MLKIQDWSRSWNKVGTATTTIVPLMGMVIMSATTPASAQSVIVEGGGFSYSVNQPATPFIYQSPNVAPFVYGSPIPTPVPVNPSTGSTPRTTYYYSYPTRGRVEDSTLVNPVLVNPRIRNSTIINPVIVDDYNYPGYRVPRVKHRRSVIRGF